MKAWVVGLSLLVLPVVSADVHPASAGAPKPDQVNQVKEFLFVQNATSGSYENGRLSLKDAGPIIFFSDRPYRIFGHTRAEHFIESWSKGPDSLAENPPNAVLSLLGDQVESFVVILSQPKIEKGVVSYRATVQDGKIPAKFGEASLFIDNNLWAAVGGLAVGRLSARREQRQQAAAFEKGQASAKQDQQTYYHAQQQAPAQHPAPAATGATATPEQQLEELKQLLDKGLISQDDYNKKKEQILKAL